VVSALRVGIIGAGWWAREVHAPAFLAAGAEISGVCSRTPESAGSLASSLCVEALPFEVLLERSDALAIASPDDTHATYAVEAARAGRHVFVEKPLGRDVAEAESILEAARAAGVLGMPGLTARGDPMTARARSIVADGAIGEVLYVRGSFDIELLADPAAPASWRTDRRVSGPGGVIADLGPHVFDLAEHVTGIEIDEVAARGGIHLQRDPPVTNLDEVAVLAGMAGASALFSMGRVNLGSSAFRLEVQGSRGAVRVEWGIWESRRTLLHASRLGGWKPVEVEHLPDQKPFSYGRAQFGQLASRFVRAIPLGEHPSPSLKDGVRVQRVVDAVWRSVEDGSAPVKVE
jgi:predicted dehydrogenase